MSITPTAERFTLEALRRKRGRYEEVNGVVCKWCADCKGFSPVDQFDYDTSLARHDAFCRAHETQRAVYAASPEGKAEAAYWTKVNEKRKAKLAAGHTPKPRKHSCHQLVDGVMHKTCTACEKLLPLDGFKKHGRHLKSQCKECCAAKDKAYREGEARERLCQTKRRYYRQNATALGAKNRARRKARPDEYRRSSREYMRRRTREDIGFRILTRLRARCRSALKGRGTKADHTIALMGCTLRQLKAHLESLWLPGMTWENWGSHRDGGTTTWQIDHVRPCASFDLTDPEEQRKCFHWSNLQPLWAADNLAKSDRTDWTPPPSS